MIHSLENSDERDDNNDSHEQALNSSLLQPTRHLERCESRRRRRLSISRSNGSSSGFSLGSSVGTYDESLDNISDSLELKSSRHSVGRSSRRRSTQNRHLHQPHRQKQFSVSTSSDPSSDFSCTSVLHKRLQNNLKAQSQHSVSSRENPRYIVVKSDPSGSEDRVSDRRHIHETRKNEVKELQTSSVEHPRFIVIQSGSKDEGEKDGKHHTRRGRRSRRVHTTEKTQSA